MLFKLDDKYGPYLQFGKTNWGGGDGTSDRGNPDTSYETPEEEIKKECEDRNAAETTYNPGADDNDTGPDDTKPQWMSDCEDAGHL